MADQIEQLTLTRVLNAPRERVFDVWTSPESMQHWMCPDGVTEVRVELDVRVGGGLRVEMLHGETWLAHTGVYREIIPPQRLVFTWSSDATQGQETLVRVELRALGDQTELTLTQTLLPGTHIAEQHTRGWSQILTCLESYIQ